MKAINLSRILLLGAIALIISSFYSLPDEKLEKEVLKETNQFRKSRGKKLLQWHDGLSELARQHSEAMASGNTPFGHQGFELREKQARKLLSARLSAVAENVAYGSETASDVVTQWKNSPGHRQNMLGNFRHIGVGTATDAEGRIYFTQIFVE